MKVKIVNNSPFGLPSYSTPLSAGMDLRAALSEPVTLKPLERQLVPTGLHIELPAGYEAQVSDTCEPFDRGFCNQPWRAHSPDGGGPS